ncbi:hypothetical protein [Breoghania sp.]|uniref:hypothetical protein n=1 Tax=Breoghania sp. TaxID=2065378 RepID=UPI0026252FBF|nr:hypothetical protein [Breoghania sp.]MDJ0932665.1 hypothetical protein [Breoghania sp.]
MFLPVAVVVLLSFNASQFGSFPMTGLSLRWFVERANNEAILRAFRTSIVLGLLTAVIRRRSASSQALHWCATGSRRAISSPRS